MSKVKEREKNNKHITENDGRTRGYMLETHSSDRDRGGELMMSWWYIFCIRELYCHDIIF